MKLPVSDCPHGAGGIPRAPKLLFPWKRARSPKRSCDACGGEEDLRVCMTCGFVGCCESHEGHDTAHFEQTGHWFIRPRLGENWLWCYGCRAYLTS